MKFISFFLSVVLASGASLACTTDSELLKQGFTREKSGHFQSIYDRLWSALEDEENIVFDTFGYTQRPGSRDFFVAVSYDDLRTPHEKMYGDILIVSHKAQGHPVEVRWFGEDGKRMYAVSDDSCAVELIPLAENVLF